MSRGFTLIELMVVVAISAVVMSGGIAAYRGFADKYQIKQAGTEFQANLKLFQKKAMSGEKPAECLGAFSGVRVWEIDSSNYKFQAQCSLSNGEEQTVALPETVVFNTAIPNFDLFFATLNSAVTGAQTVEITVTGSVIYEVIIEASGVIKGGLQ